VIEHTRYPLSDVSVLPDPVLEVLRDSSPETDCRDHSLPAILHPHEETTGETEAAGQPREGMGLDAANEGNVSDQYRGYALGIGSFMLPPTLEDATSALDDLTKILKPPWTSGSGYKDP
jgi:hypothetical protein